MPQKRTPKPGAMTSGSVLPRAGSRAGFVGFVTWCAPHPPCGHLLPAARGEGSWKNPRPRERERVARSAGRGPLSLRSERRVERGLLRRFEGDVGVHRVERARHGTRRILRRVLLEE